MVELSLFTTAPENVIRRVSVPRIKAPFDAARYVWHIYRPMTIHARLTRMQRGRGAEAASVAYRKHMRKCSPGDEQGSTKRSRNGQPEA